MIRKLIGMHRRQRGITGLETAIILIAFVVVASVFAYTVLSAGLFSTEKSQESIHAGLEEAQSTIQLRSHVTGYADLRTEVSSVSYNVDTAAPLNTINGDDALALSKVEFMVSVCEGGEMVDLTPPFEPGAGNNISGNDSIPAATRTDSVTQIAYSDENIYISECAWSVEWVGTNSGDYILDPGEKAIITVYLLWQDTAIGGDGGWALGSDSTDPFIDTAGTLVQTNHKFTLEVKPSKGAVLTIERTTPGYLDTTNDLA